MLKKDIRQRKGCPIIFSLLGLSALQSGLREQFILTGVPEGTVRSGKGSMVTTVSSFEELAAGPIMVAARKQLGPGAIPRDPRLLARMQFQRFKWCCSLQDCLCLGMIKTDPGI